MKPVTDAALVAQLESGRVRVADPAVIAELERQEQLQRTRDAARDTYADMSTGDRLAVGFARPFVELGLGAKDLAGRIGWGGGLTDEDRSNMERLQQVTGGAGTVGRIGGDLAAFALPAGAVGKGASMLPRAVAAYALPAADIALSAGMEALKAPTEDTTRTQRAIGGAVGAATGQVLGKTLGALARGVQPTAAAQKLMQEGVPLTPGQAKGGALQAIENHAANVPFVGSKIRERQAEAIASWNRQVLNSVMPEGAVTEAGHAGFRQATKAFRESYERLWNQNVPYSAPTLEAGWKQVVDDAQRTLTPEVSNKLQSNLYRLYTDMILPAHDGKVLPGTVVSKLDDMLREAGRTAFRQGDTDLSALYGAARSQMRAQLPTAVRSELSRLDNLYKDFAVVRRAGSAVGAGARGQPFTPAQLLNASRSADRTAGKGATAMGTAPMQRQAQAALEVFGDRPRPPDTLSKVILGVAGLPAALPARMAYSRLGTAHLTGQNPNTQAIINALRRTTRSGQIGAALEE